MDTFYNWNKNKTTFQSRFHFYPCPIWRALQPTPDFPARRLQLRLQLTWSSLISRHCPPLHHLNPTLGVVSARTSLLILLWAEEAPPPVKSWKWSGSSTPRRRPPDRQVPRGWIMPMSQSLGDCRPSAPRQTTIYKIDISGKKDIKISERVQNIGLNFQFKDKAVNEFGFSCTH